MRYKNYIDKEYLNLFVDAFEKNLKEDVDIDLDKRSSVTERGGRPYSFSPREIGDQMLIYFRNCTDNNAPFMITGLCMTIGISREGLRKMEKGYNDQLVGTIKKGKQMIELYWEIQGQLMPNPSWAIFVLKVMGWRDKKVVEDRQEVQLTDREKIEAQKRLDNFSEV